MRGWTLISLGMILLGLLAAGTYFVELNSTGDPWSAGKALLGLAFVLVGIVGALLPRSQVPFTK